MNEQEEIILLNIKDFCKSLPGHVQKWQTALEPTLKQVRGISNMAEQLRAVTEVNIDYMRNFKETQERLRYNIISCIEEDFLAVRYSIEKFSRINADLRNKLVKLETSSLELDWEQGDSQIIRGTPTIPPLNILLQKALDFQNFFNNAYKMMQNCTKSINFLDEKCMQRWENAFVIDLNNNTSVNYLIALTQYVNQD